MPTVDYPLIHSHTDQWCWSPLTAKSAHITHSSSLWSWLQPSFFFPSFFLHCFSVGIRQIAFWTIRKDTKDGSSAKILKTNLFIYAGICLSHNLKLFAPVFVQESHVNHNRNSQSEMRECHVKLEAIGITGNPLLFPYPLPHLRPERS